MGKSTPVPVGNINLKGKKYRLLSCGCCEAYDMREDVRRREDEKEIRECLNGTSFQAVYG